MNRLSVFLWIIKVLESCNTLEHLNCCERLIDRHFFLYQDIGMYQYLHQQIAMEYGDYKSELEQAYLETNENLEQ